MTAPDTTAGWPDRRIAPSAEGPCIFDGCVSRERHWHFGFPGGYTNPADPEGAPIPFTREPEPGVRDYNGAILTHPPRVGDTVELGTTQYRITDLYQTDDGPLARLVATGGRTFVMARELRWDGAMWRPETAAEAREAWGR